MSTFTGVMSFLLGVVVLIAAIYFFKMLKIRSELVPDEAPEEATSVEDSPKKKAKIRLMIKSAIFSWSTLVLACFLGIGILKSVWWLAFLAITIICLVFLLLLRKFLSSNGKSFFAIVAILSFLLATVILMLSSPGGPGASSSEVKVTEVSQSETTVVAEAVIPPPTVDCPAEFVQTGHMAGDDSRINDQLASDLAKISNDSLSMSQAVRASYISDEVSKVLQQSMGSNVRALTSASLVFGTMDESDNNPEFIQLLLTPDGTCLSDKGQALFALTNAVMTPNIDSIQLTDSVPNGLVNSGWQDGRLVVAEEPGIRGDLSGIEIILRDKSRIYVLGRCENWTLPPNGNLVPKLPPGKTDNPGKGTTQPDSENGFLGDTSGGGAEMKAPQGPSTSGDGGATWQPARPANPGTKPGSVAPPTAQAPSTGGGSDLSQPTPPTGGATVDPGTSGTTPGGGTPTVPDSGSDNTGIQAPPD